MTKLFTLDDALAPDVSVYVRPLDGRLGWEQRTDADGVARFEDLPREVVDVHLDRAPLRERVDLRLRSTVDNHALTFRMRPWALKRQAARRASWARSSAA